MSSNLILDPADLEFLDRTFHEIAAEPWFTKDQKEAERFAAILIAFYKQLYTADPERFVDFARTHARHNFRCRPRFDEDIARLDH